MKEQQQKRSSLSYNFLACTRLHRCGANKETSVVTSEKEQRDKLALKKEFSQISWHDVWVLELKLNISGKLLKSE